MFFDDMFSSLSSSSLSYRKIRLPEINELSDEQRQAIDFYEPMAVYGGGGTGKTVVLAYKHIKFWNEGIRSAYVTFTHSLTRYVELAVQDKNPVASDNIFNKDSFVPDSNISDPNISVVMIDEAQDIDVVSHCKVSCVYSHVSYGASDDQILYPDRATTTKRLEKIYKPKGIFYLTENFRNSYEIIQFVNALFSNKDSGRVNQNRKVGEKPRLVYSGKYSTREMFLVNLLKTLQGNYQHKSVGVLFPEVKLLQKFSELLQQHGIVFSQYSYINQGAIRHEDIANIHLTTFKSSKGLEFDTVVIPEIQKFQQFQHLPTMGSESIVNANDYYVGMIRAREQLIMLSDRQDVFPYVNRDLYDIQEIN